MVEVIIMLSNGQVKKHYISEADKVELDNGFYHVQDKDGNMVKYNTNYIISVGFKEIK